MYKQEFIPHLINALHNCWLQYSNLSFSELLEYVSGGEDYLLIDDKSWYWLFKQYTD